MLNRIITSRYRLLPIVIGIPLLPIGLFVYGWTAQYKVHWIVPIIATSLTGAGLIFSYVSGFSPLSTEQTESNVKTDV